MNQSFNIQTTESKALQLNLSQKYYGTFAEIGGGQEVARFFFRAGAASGTIAKTISAYDKIFSDKLYSKNNQEKYVSENRLIKMVDTEYKDLLQNLDNSQFNNKLFFAFANTVEILNYNKTNNGHGWLGIKFQVFHDSQPNTVILHANFKENESNLQQFTLGVLGVNLIHSCLCFYNNPKEILNNLLDNLSTDRVEINMISMTGPQFQSVDNRLLSLQLVKNKMTEATIFDRYGKVHHPADFLYKKNLLLLRGSFRPITYIGFDMLKSSFGFFKKTNNFELSNTIQLCEITLSNLLQEGKLNEEDFLARVDLINGMGQNVMISNFQEFYKLSNYLAQFNIKNIKLIIGANILCKLMQKAWYLNFKGGILKALGMLLPENTQIYVYPFYDSKTNSYINTSNIDIEEDINYLYKHLIFNKKIIDLPNFNKKIKKYSSREVLELIKNSDPQWEVMVPKYISKNIKSKNLFGFQE